MGFVLLGMLPGSASSAMAPRMYYIILYSLMSAAGFRYVDPACQGSGVEAENLDDLQRSQPAQQSWYAAIMAMVMFVHGRCASFGWFFRQVAGDQVCCLDAGLSSRWRHCRCRFSLSLERSTTCASIKLMYFDEPLKASHPFSTPPTAFRSGHFLQWNPDVWDWVSSPSSLISICMVLSS